MADIRQNAVGLLLNFTIRNQAGVALDVSAATTLQLTMEKPDGSKLVAPLSLLTTGADGKVKYVTVAGDIDQSGIWRAQVYVVVPGGHWYTDVASLTVKPNL